MNRQLNQHLVEIRSYLEAQPLTEAKNWSKAQHTMKQLVLALKQAIEKDSPEAAASSIHDAIGLLGASLLWATGDRKPTTILRKAMGSLDKLLPAETG